MYICNVGKLDLSVNRLPFRIQGETSERLTKTRGVARIFQREVHNVSNIIVMEFSPRNIIGCFLKRGIQRGITGTPGPPPPPPHRYALEKRSACIG